MRAEAKLPHGETWQAQRNGTSTQLGSLQDSAQPLLWFRRRLTFPEWGQLKMSENNSRFSMSYAMLAIMVSLLAIVIGAVVTVGVAATVGVVSILQSQTRLETQMATMLKEQEAQRIEIGGIRAYANQLRVEVAEMKPYLPAPARKRFEEFEKANPPLKDDEQ